MLTKSLRPAAARYSPHPLLSSSSRRSVSCSPPPPPPLLILRPPPSPSLSLHPLSISGYQLTAYAPATMMLLIGMKINFTKKPINPMIAKPTEVA